MAVRMTGAFDFDGVQAAVPLDDDNDIHLRAAVRPPVIEAAAGAGCGELPADFSGDGRFELDGIDALRVEEV